MKLIVPWTLLSLVSCQNQGYEAITPIALGRSDVRFERLTNTGCAHVVTGFRSKGSKLRVPGFSENFGAIIHYSPNQGGGGAVSIMNCPGTNNQYGVPIPEGYTPDAFCQLAVNQAITFSDANLIEKVESTTLLPDTDYSLYAYDAAGNLLGSYGPGQKEHKSVSFTSPLENGFRIDNIVNLELAHPTN